MSDFDEAVIQRIKQLEREVERLQKWERPVIITDHGALAGLADNDHPQYLLTTGKAADSDKLDGLDSTAFLLTTGKAADSDKLDGYNSTDFGRPVFLAAPKTSTSWDGDAKSSTLKTLIDLSSVFGVPAGVKAVLAQTIMRDSGSSTHNNFFILDGTDADSSGALTNTSRTLPNDTTAYAYGIVPCDANGDIYYQINASGSLTMDCWIRIWGWWL